MIFKKIYISLAFFIVAAIALISFAIIPLAESIKEDGENFIGYQNELNLAERKIDNLKGFKKVYPDYKQNLEKIDNLFVEAEAPIEFLTFLERTAYGSQIFLKVSSSKAQEGAPDYWPSLVFQISTYGTPANFLKFLEKVENSNHLIEINNLTIKKLSEKELMSKEIPSISTEDISATFSLKAFVKSK